MKLKQLNEAAEHPAIKIRYYSSDNENAVVVHSLMEGYRLDLRKIPTEMTITLAEKKSFYDVEGYFELRQRVAAFKDSNPELHDKLGDMLFNLRYIEMAEEQADEFKAEATELLEHITTYLKGRLIQFAEEAQQRIGKEQAEGIKKLKAELDKHEAK